VENNNKVARALAASASLVLAAFLALVGWMHGARLSAFLPLAAPLSATLFFAASLLSLAFAARFAFVPSAGPRWFRYALVGAAVVALMLLPGRIVLLRKLEGEFLTDTQREIHKSLRLLASAQEDHRIGSGAYTATLKDLAPMLMSHVADSVKLRVSAVRDSTSWSGSGSIGAVSCSVTIERAGGAVIRNGFLDDEVACGVGSAAASDPTTRPTDLQEVATEQLSASPLRGEDAWPQERGDAARTAIGSSALPSLSWGLRTGFQFRALPAVAGAIGFVGAHGSGWLGAVDMSSGRLLWTTRVPNWIHQNPVVSHGVVVVGVGDKHHFHRAKTIGLGPGGVAAFEATTGRLRWFARSDAAVMTAPAIHDSTVVYADGAGWLFARSLSTGAQLWQARLQGHVIMASPAISSGRVFVAQDPRTLCAFSISSGNQLWCYRAPDALSMGSDVTPSVIGNAVYWSLSGPVSGWTQLRTSPKAAAAYLRERLLGTGETRAVQWVVAVDAETGAQRWLTSLGFGGEARGNIAGTPIGWGESVVVVAPLARAVASLNQKSGSVTWFRRMDAFARGAPTIVDSTIIVTDFDAHLHLLSARDGSERCRANLPEATDRSGPVIFGQNVIFAGRAGFLYARPLSQILACSTGE
jgi:outer membrane protein assembly factor BamB